VRYRVRATDGRDVESTAPFTGDPEPNLAYFVYDGVPDYVAGRSRFGPAAHVHTDLEKVPVYFFLIDAGDFQEVQHVEILPRNGYHWRLIVLTPCRLFRKVYYGQGSAPNRFGLR
jgi:hypothetical protein